MQRRPTIIDVARRAGVSTATVSRVLNGGPVMARTRHAVEAAITLLEYRPNRLARGLVTGRSGVLGVLIPDVMGPLYSAMARGVEVELAERSMHYIMVTVHRDPKQETTAIDLLLARRVDGLVLIGSQLDDRALQQLRREVTVCAVQREHGGDGGEDIGLDNRAGIEAAIAHLVAYGHRHIAHVAGVRRDGRERLEAFREVLTRLGFEPGPVIASDFSERSGVQAAEALLQHADVTAVLCANDRIALGLYHGMARRHRNLPRDLSVVGFDDLSWGAFLDPPLTTVRQPAFEMGRAAARMALGATGDSAGYRLVKPGLVARSSVGPPRDEPRYPPAANPAARANASERG